MNQTFDYLAGLRVVEVSAFVSAPLAGAVLASMGAEVIRVDPVAGPTDGDRWPLDKDGRSLYWAGLNEGKQSVAVDLSRDEGRDVVIDLIASGDGILLTNSPAGADRLGAALGSRMPDAIICEITGHPGGLRAVDYTVNAAVGFPQVTGPPGLAGPVNSVFPAWDVTAGLHAALVLLGAVHRRRRTGEGARLTVSLFETALSLTGRLGIYAELMATGSTRERIGNHLYGAFGHDFLTGDGQRVMIVAITAAQLGRLAAATGLERELARLEDQRGRSIEAHGDLYEAREALAALLAPWFAALPMTEVERVLDRHGVLYAPYQSFAESVQRDGRWSAKHHLRDAFRRDGTHVALGPHPFRDGTEFGPGHVPLSGEDTIDVLGDLLGYSPETLEQLASRGLIGHGNEGRTNV